jgi:glycosyltransferase involved in cell wall biosynthesis
MHILIATHTDQLRLAARQAAQLLSRQRPMARISIVDLAAPMPGTTAQQDRQGVWHLPADESIPMAASGALAEGARLAAWLQEQQPDIALIPADAGLAHFALLQRSQGLTPMARIGCLLTLPAEIEAVGRERWLRSPQVLENATTTGAALSAADVVLVAAGVTTAALEERGWMLPANTLRDSALDARSLVRAVDLLAADFAVSSATDAMSAHATPHATPHATGHSAPMEWPRVSVCVTHHERPALLRQTLESIAQQDYPNLEVIVVDDGSRDTTTVAALETLASWIEERGWRLLRQPNRYLGAARNTAWRAASGHYVFFLDDDDCFKPDALQTLATAARHSRADVVTCFLDYFEGTEAPHETTPIHHRWVMPGPCGAQSLLQNDFGAAAALVRRSLLEELGGYSEDFGVGFEDWEFWLRAYTAGARFTVVPRALLWIRWNIGGMQQTTASKHLANHSRALRGARAHLPAVLYDLPALLVGLHRENQALRQQLETRAVDAAPSEFRSVAVRPADHDVATPESTGNSVQISQTATPATGIQREVRCHVWHTEGLGLSGILSWMWRLKTQFGPAAGLEVRLVDLAVWPYGFQQVGSDPAVLYDQRIDTLSTFVDFLAGTSEDVHLVNHAFPYLTWLIENRGLAWVQALHLVGVCHTDQEYYYGHLARLAPALKSIVCVSEVCATTLAQRIPDHAHKLQVLPAWAVALPDSAVHAPEPGEPLRLLYTGRILQAQKRVLDLAILAIELRQAGVNAELTIIGDGPDLDILRHTLAEAAAWSIPVALEPVRAPWDMADVLCRHHALVQVSEFEGASVSLMEALAHGLVPVVTATRSGHDLLTAGENAIMAPIGDMRGLAQALAAVWASPERFRALQQAACHTARHYLTTLDYPARFAELVRSVPGERPARLRTR